MRVGLAALCLALAAGLTLAQPPKTAPAKPTEPPKPAEVTLDGLKSAVPAKWQAQTPANKLRSYQFKAPRAAGDKEDAEVYVLTTVHGTPQENLARLKELFLLPTDLPKDKALREWEIKNAKATLTCVDVQGTYRVKNRPLDAAVKEVRPDYRMIAAVWTTPESAYSIRLVGPKKTVEAHAKAFEQWLRNFK